MIRLRPPTPADAEAVAALVIASDVADLGEPDYSVEALRDEWAASDFELARDAVVADDDALHAVRGAAFSANPDYDPETREAFADHHLRVHDLDPALSRVAERDGALAGFALVRRWEEGVATRLYERAGMTRRWRVDSYERVPD